MVVVNGSTHAPSGAVPRPPADDVDGGPTARTAFTLHHRSVVELAADEVCRLIFAGVFAPGEHLPEEQLTQQLGISRPPLREALRILTEQGLLEQTPRRGVAVMRLSDEDRREIYTLRDSLERFALDLVLSARPPTTFEVLRVALDEMWVAARAGDAAGMLAANRSFHIGFVSLAGHRRLIKTYTSLMRQMQLYMSVNLRSEAGSAGNPYEGCRRHERFYVTLCTGSAEEIRHELTMHGASTYIDHG